MTSGIATSSTESQRNSSTLKVWGGRILWALVVPFLLMDSGMHLVNPSFVIEASEKLGLPSKLATPIGVVELVCLVLFLVPRTAVIGAILLTGYLGGAVAIQLRVGGPYLFAVFVGALLWGSLYCRDDRVRSLIR